jgi:hypothetical protein
MKDTRERATALYDRIRRDGHIAASAKLASNIPDSELKSKTMAKVAIFLAGNGSIGDRGSGGIRKPLGYAVVLRTFINNLREDLEKDLAKVFTLHGYCQSLLRKPLDSRLGDGLTIDFRCLPGFASLIKTDWKYLNGEPVPQANRPCAVLEP